MCDVVVSSLPVGNVNGCAPMKTTNLKVINYRGSVVRFRIPAGWNEEYEEDGGGTFYLPGDESGTLRLNVLTLEGPEKQRQLPEAAAKILAPDAAKYQTEVV